MAVLLSSTRPTFTSRLVSSSCATGKAVHLDKPAHRSRRTSTPRCTSRAEPPALLALNGGTLLPQLRLDRLLEARLSTTGSAGSRSSTRTSLRIRTIGILGGVRTRLLHRVRVPGWSIIRSDSTLVPVPIDPRLHPLAGHHPASTMPWVRTRDQASRNPLHRRPKLKALLSLSAPRVRITRLLAHLWCSLRLSTR